MQQHTLAFKVRTGTEELAAALLCSYEPPRLKIDDHTSLLATAVFISGDQLVRSIEVEGDLAAVSRHLATDPNIRKVEGQLVQYLAEPYDLADPMAARASFQRRLMKQVGTIGPDTRIASESRLSRLAVKFPIPAGTAEQVARLLAGTGESSFPECDVFVRLAIFAQGDSTLVGIVTTDGTIDQSLDLLAGSPVVEELAGTWLGDSAPTVQSELTNRIRAELEANLMTTILERDNAGTPAR